MVCFVQELDLLIHRRRYDTIFLLGLKPKSLIFVLCLCCVRYIISQCLHNYFKYSFLHCPHKTLQK